MNNFLKSMYRVGLLSFGLVFAFTLSINAVTIIETTNSEDEYDTIENNEIIVGITKFEANEIITEDKLTVANENFKNFNKNNNNYSPSATYYYLHNTWYKIDDNNNVIVMSDDHFVEDLNMQDIYYINNNEKKLQVEYSVEKVEGFNLNIQTDKENKNKDVKFENNKLIVPATINNLNISYVTEDLAHKEELAVIEKESLNSTKFNIRWSEKISQDGEFKYIVQKPGVCQITKYIGNKTEVTIPAECDGYKVYSVGNKDISNISDERYNIFGKSNLTHNETITKIVISEGIEVIEDAAFNGCSKLKEIGTLPSTLKQIGNYAFNNCTSLVGDLNLPEGITIIGRGAFQNCYSLNGNLKLPSTLTNIKPYAFNQCKNLNGNLNFPDGLKEIGRTAFQNCKNLSGDIIIPNGITSIEDYTFNNCENIKGKLVLPEGVVSIGKTAFQYTGITGELKLPETLTKIDSFAFNKCKGLSGNLIIPNNVKTIGSWSFQGCLGLDGTLTLSNSLEEIGDGFMNHCSNLTNTEIIIPKSLKKIGSLKNDATHTFNNCATNTLKEYKIEEGNEYFKTIDGVLYSNDGTRLIAYPSAKEGEEFIVPEGVIKFDELAFSRAGSEKFIKDTSKTIKKVVIPNSFIFKTELPENYLNKGNNLSVAIYKYTGIKEVIVSEDNKNYKVVDNVVYSNDGTISWYIPVIINQKINLIDTLKTIKEGTFFAEDERPNSQIIVLPASVTNIDEKELPRIKILINRNMLEINKDSIYEIKGDGNIGLK